MHPENPYDLYAIFSEDGTHTIGVWGPMRCEVNPVPPRACLNYWKMRGGYPGDPPPISAPEKLYDISDLNREDYLLVHRYVDGAVVEVYFVHIADEKKLGIDEVVQQRRWKDSSGERR